MYKRWNTKKLALFLFTIMQLTLFLIYWVTQEQNTNETTTHNLKNPVLFISTNDNRTSLKIKYFTERKKVVLRTKSVDDVYEDFNTSLCYKKGTDLKVMKRSKNLNWKCVCQSGWHGNDCGQPEVIWRALLASRKRSIIPSLRKFQRRLIYLIEVNIITEHFMEIAFNELNETVDLFIVCDLSNTSSTIESRLKNGFLRNIAEKILYISGVNRNEVWRKARKTIRNLRDDDIFFINNPYEVPNVKALEFLKLYDKLPELLLFRLKWSVYGFFWRHPKKTVLSSGACTLKYLYEALGNDVDNLKSLSQGFIIGDLNHFGGWFCQYCNEPSLIIKSLQNNLIDITLNNKKINMELMEDFIENGIYLDGKTSLQRVYRSRENYYAPNVVINSNWKYDWLTVNLYSKMDYY